MLVGAAYWVITFVYREVRVETSLTPAQARLSDLYVNYSVDPESYISAESYLAMGRYQREHPEPQNIQVLVGESTTEVIGYMINYYSGGLGVDCTHCHSLQNF
ncbi:MAG: hypothetical protein HC828_08820, partial [Blastochloris sp.]|nr:hypothetical protein [Blastochloris sp.]